MNRSAVTFWAAALAACALVTGCGGGSDSSGGDEGNASGGSISKAEFVKQANAICAEASQGALNEIGDAGGGKGNPAEAILGSYSKEVEEIEALGAPSGMEAEVEAFLRSLEKGVEAGESPEGLLSANKLIAKAREQAEAIGLTSCPAG